MANGIINLQTDLKSLKYGSMPLGSDKPYVTKDIGQAPGSQIGRQIQSRIDDTSRIAQMLIDKPGLKFIANQALLQQVNIQDKLQKNRDNGNNTLADAIIKQGLETVKQTAKILGSTLAQVPVNGTGTHFVYAFRTDTYLQPPGGNNRTAFAQFFGAGGVEGAPFALKGKEVPGKVETQFIGVRGDVISPEGGDAKFTYNAPVKQDGDGGTNWNEKSNKQILETIPRESSREYSKRGLPIPVTTAAPTPATGRNADTGETVTIPGLFIPNPLNTKDTTLTSGSLGISNRDVTGTVTSGDFTYTKFDESKVETKSKGNTSQNILNALTGSAVALKGGVRETTAAVEGSRSNKDVTSDIAENSTNNVGETVYSSGNTYTGTSTQDAINAAVGGTIVYTNKLSGSYRPSDPNPATNTQASYQPFGNPVPISEISEKDETKGPTTGIYDFRKRQGKPYSFDYNAPKINRETRINLGNQGKVSFNRSNYGNSSDEDTHDKLNKLSESTNRIDGTEDARDLAKLYFEIITPDGSTFLHFRAFIDSIDDSYTADWQGSKYVGRAENFYTYGGFDRDINISFKIAAATRAEMKPLYRKMVYLASATAPTYGDKGFMRGTLARMTIGSYITQIPGVITSVKYNLIQDMPWEISMQNPEAGTDDDMQELPMGLQCSVSFKPIHDFAPQTGLQHYFTSPNPLNGSKSFLI